MTFALVLALAVLVPTTGRPAAAQDLGGHPDPSAQKTPEVPADERHAILEEMWQRRLLPPDQSSWAPEDEALLNKIRAVEKDAIAYLRRIPGGTRPWTAKPRAGSDAGWKLTKEGYARYMFLLSQDAIVFFEGKGADAKWVFKLRDSDGKPLFDGTGLVTNEGARVYRLAKLNLEVYWSGPNGDAYGTRRPPTKIP
jgi:hypothetical protein